jgi:hypothetical protein
MEGAAIEPLLELGLMHDIGNVLMPIACAIWVVAVFVGASICATAFIIEQRICEGHGAVLLHYSSNPNTESSLPKLVRRKKRQ